MKCLDTDIIAEVRQNREALLEKYGGIEGYLKHLAEERPQLEKDGWKFVSIDEVPSRNHHLQTALS
ncbi:hypothetical protein AGMMS4952_08750 [Spirochaetia bacterium]|nr:hypothetical protein AGMMS4952_08750 [Spirochaetia bacterium]